MLRKKRLRPRLNVLREGRTTLRASAVRVVNSLPSVAAGKPAVAMALAAEFQPILFCEGPFNRVRRLNLS
jgi:hypothetical protein